MVLCGSPSNNANSFSLPDLFSLVCDTYKQDFKTYNVCRREMLQELTENQKKIQVLLPLLTTSRDRPWSKRGLINLVGLVGKRLFGFSTMKDLHALQMQIDEIERSSKQEAEYLKVTIEKMQSYEQTLNKRVVNMKRAIEINKMMLNSTLKDLEVWKTVIETLAVTIRNQAMELYKTRAV